LLYYNPFLAQPFRIFTVWLLVDVRPWVSVIVSFAV
jgi:hypothetical protein